MGRHTHLFIAIRGNSSGYCDGKEEYMKSLEEKALHWQEKQNRISLGISLDLMFGIAFGFRDKDNSRQK